MKKPEQQEEQMGFQGTLTYYIYITEMLGEFYYKAVCPELDIACGEKTQEGATKDLFLRARYEVRGILEGKGDLPDRPDERRPIAESLKGVEDISKVFERVPVPVLMGDGLN